MQPLGDMTFGHVISKLRTLYHNFHKDTITKLGWNTWLPLLYVTWFIITCFFYILMSFRYVMWSRNLLKRHSPTSKKTITTKLGGNTYKNERVAYLHMTWVNHTKVMKGTSLNRSCDYWLYDVPTNEKSIRKFYKSC